MFRAFPLRDRNGNYIGQGQTPAQRELERRAYWASTFRSMGNVVHLLQDLAKPQHARNEGHGVGHAAIYEKYVDARADSRVAAFTFDLTTLTRVDRTLAPLDYLGKNAAGNPYPIPRFDSFTDYFSTARGAAPRGDSLSQGGGLAGYSSRGFLTRGSSLGFASVYPQPPRDPASYIQSTEDSLCDTPGDTLVKWKYLKTVVTDFAAPTYVETVRQQSPPVWIGAAGGGAAPLYTM